MLSLASTTGRAWVERACAHLDEILLDHAHCEKKAASTAVSLLFKYAERRELLVTLSQLAAEARHHETYVELATAVAPDARVRTRLRELALHEAAVLASAPPIARLHA